MKLRTIVSVSAALALIASLPVAAQFGGGGFGRPSAGGFGRPSQGGFGAPKSAAAAPPAWKSFKLNPNIRVTLDFRNASVDAILHYFSQQSGIAIIKDPTLTGGLTLESPKPQSLNDAFEMLSVVLGLKNFGITKQADFLLITPKQSAQPSFPHDFAAFGGGRNASELRVYLLHYASATTLATTINQVFATTATAAPAAGPGFPGAPGGPGGPFARFLGRQNQATAEPIVKVSADDYSNSLIVNAPSAEQDEISGIIDQIDRPTDQPETAKVFPLKYALATDLESEIQSVLSGTVPLGRAATAQTTAQQRNQPNGRVPFFMRFMANSNSNTNNNGTVTADSRTNSLIVTTTQDNMEEVTQVIEQLDKPETYVSTTFVYVMKNARADVVANLLNESFGNRTTNGPVGGSLTNPSFSSGTLGTSTSSTTTTGPGGARVGANNTNFQVTTSNNMQNQAAESQGLNEDGRVVNIRNLSGQVLLVPDIDTNSIIVVAPPEDKGILTGILEKMDQIPAQVMIETLVVEASLTKADSLGIEYNFNIPGLGGHGLFGGTQNYGTASTGTTVSAQNTALGLPAGGQFTLSAGQYSVVLSAIQQNSIFNVLSTPRIFTTNNATAQINISESLPYVTNQTVNTTGTVLYNYNFLDVGIVLTVTPRITSNGYVTMDVTQTANDFVSYTSFNAPIVNQRETQTTVSVENGNTVVLGGIINNQVTDTVNKIPLLGDIPILGNLFRSTSKQDQKTELLVFLTPHIVTNPEDAQKLRLATEQELGKTTQEMLPATSKSVSTAAK